MPKNDIEQLKTTLTKVASELSRQSKQAERIVAADEKRLRKILDKGMEGMDAGLSDLLVEVIFSKPFGHGFPSPRARKGK